MNLIKVSPLKVWKRTAKAVLVLQDTFEVVSFGHAKVYQNDRNTVSKEIWLPLSQVALEGDTVVAVADWLRAKNQLPRDWQGYKRATAGMSLDKLKVASETWFKV